MMELFKNPHFTWQTASLSNTAASSLTIEDYAERLKFELLGACPAIGQTHALPTPGAPRGLRFCLGEPMPASESQIFALGNIRMLNEAECSQTGTVGFMCLSLRPLVVHEGDKKTIIDNALTLNIIGIEPKYRALRIASKALTALTQVASISNTPVVIRNVKSEMVQARCSHLGYEIACTHQQVHMIRLPSPLSADIAGGSIYASSLPHPHGKVAA